MSSTDDQTSSLLSRHAVQLFGDANTQMAAYCDPSLSLIIVPPSITPNGESERLGTLQYPVTVAGHYTQTPLPHAIRRHTRRAEQALYSIHSIDISEIASQLVRTETKRRYLFDAFEDVFRTVIQWELQQLFSDDEFVEWYASTYAVDNPGVQAKTIQQHCEIILSHSGRPYPAAEFGQILTRLAADYPLGVVRLVVRLVLSPPVQLKNPGPSNHPTNWNLDLTDRARHVAETLAQEIEMAPQDDNETLGCSVKDLQDRLRKASPLSVRLLTDSTDRQPLLAIPHREENQVTTDPIHAELTGYPSGTAWLLDTGYTEAGFGGVVYPRQQGEMTWLLNPWIANSDVSQDQIYRHLMSEALVADHLLQDLFEIVEESTGDIDPPQQSVECPLCRLYADQCGETDCAFNRQISRFTAQRVELATLVANEIEQLPNEQQDLFY